MKKMQGMLTGIMLGATAVSLYGMASSRTQRRLHRAASHAGKRIVGLAESLMGR
ncbi:MAG: hypothetical protein IJC54_08210 [Clostridia bacterium]|nr:hypothetical protein [Clostridia bacterium]MBQ4086534.1 hypothetical protein [Clostridia bacterium]